MEATMKIDNHVKVLIGKHAALDTEIDKLVSSHYHNESHMHELKKQRLKIKEEITRLQNPQSSQQHSVS